MPRAAGPRRCEPTAHTHPEPTALKLAIIADTHLPRGTRRLPARCVAELQAADLIVHAGDFTRLSVLEELETFGRVLAVHGNVDEPALSQRLPEQVEIELADGIRLAVVHDAGPARGRLERLKRRFPSARAVVFGHSHIPRHETAPDGFEIFNPGSPTDRRRSPRHTMGLARVEAGRLQFRTVALD